MPDDMGTPPLLTDFYARLAAAREEGRQQGRKEVLDVVLKQERACLEAADLARWANEPTSAAVMRSQANLLRTMRGICGDKRHALDALPAEEAQHE